MFCAVALLSAACGDDGDSGDGGPQAGTESGSDEALEFKVQVDGDSEEFNGEFAAFFPSKLRARPGDTVSFELPRFSGAPHTVTLGTMVNAAIAKFRQVPPTATIAATENFPEMTKLTDVFPHEAPQGPPVPNRSAAGPCFLETGEPPNNLKGGAPACPETKQPEFDGTYSFYNSGALMADGDEFSMTLSDDIEPGTYNFICLIHRGGMSGDLEVVEADAAVPSPEEVAADGEKEFTKLEAIGVNASKQIATATPDKAAAGAGDPTAPSLIVAEFGPETVSIPVGGSVTWNIFALHTISFNTKDSDIGVLLKAPDGSFAFPPSGAPSGFTVPPELGGFPPPDDSKPVAIDGGKWDGAGPRSTGIIGSLPPRFVSVKQTFTKAGTYTVQCLVHPDMKGEVNVG